MKIHTGKKCKDEKRKSKKKFKKKKKKRERMTGCKIERKNSEKVKEIRK